VCKQSHKLKREKAYAICRQTEMPFTEKGSSLPNCKLFLNATRVSEALQRTSWKHFKTIKDIFLPMSFKEMALRFSFIFLNKTVDVTREKKFSLGS